MSKIVALIGHGGSGKTTFACMCSCINGTEVAGFHLDGPINSAIYNFINNDALPHGTELHEWDIGIIKRESLFRKLNINFIDCAGQVQTDIYKEMSILANEHTFKRKKIDYNLVLGHILETSDTNTKDYVRKNIKSSFREWIAISDLLSKKNGEYKISEYELSKLHFMKLFIDANVLIFAINGDWLNQWYDKKGHHKDLYKQLKDYGVMASIKKTNPIAIMFTQSHLFGMRKDDNSARSREKMYDAFDNFIDLYRLNLKEVLRNRKWKKFCIGVPSSEKKSETHAGTDEIFGVEELIEWLY